MIVILVNTASIILGGLIGIIFKKYIKKEICKQVLVAEGIVVMIIAIIGIVKTMVVINGNTISTQNELLLLISISIGTFIGEVIDIDKYINKFGKGVERKIAKEGVAQGLIYATLIFCVGTMAIVGSINAALGNNEILYLKSILDGITALILATTLGLGVVLSSILVLGYQGLLFLLGLFLGNVMSEEFINSFSMVGYVMIFCIGLNFIREEKIKVSNMIPSLFIVILYYLIFV